MKRVLFGSLTTVTALTLALGLLCSPVGQAARKIIKPPKALDSFTDPFSSFDTSRWMKADGWKNGPPFDNGWRAENIEFLDGLMAIRLDDVPFRGEPFSSGNYQTLGFYGYGCYEASFKPVASPGVVSSFFTFAGPYDNGGNGRHNEIDIEFLGYDTEQVQLNFWTNDDSYTGGHEELVPLGFDAADEFHRYGFKWTSTGIQWFVDGEQVHQVSDSEEDPTPKAEESLHKIMMNVWPVDETAAAWAGTFDYPGQPLYGDYDWVRHIAGEDCSLEDPPDQQPPPPPPDGDAADIHVENIEVQMNSRGTQAIARVTVLNGIGQPVGDVAVFGAWAGLTINGDTERVTGSDGVAIFYSARFRGEGDVSFCVTGLTAPDLRYDANANMESCDQVSNTP